MKILFICGNIEPGKDGVGDYTRRLAGNLLKSGCEVFIISLYDAHVSDPISGFQHIEESRVNTFRIPVHFKDKQRFFLAGKSIAEFNPDWVSVQFVIFSFHPKGLPWTLAGNLKRIIGSRKIHIMFHELWVGIKDVNSSLKQRILATLQKFIINKLLNVFGSAKLSTSIELYQEQLTNKKNISLLYLFGNIPYVKNEISPFNSETFNIIHFGTYSTNQNDFIIQLKSIKQMLQAIKKEGVFYSLGNGGKNTEKACSIAADIFGTANCYNIGKMSETELSRYFQHADIGVSRADINFFGKSGSTIAMLEHGLPIVLRGENKYISREHPFADLIHTAADLSNSIPKRKQVYSLLKHTSNKLIRLMD